MNYYSYLIFLISMSGVSLAILIVLGVLEIAKVNVQQKINVFKIGLVMIGFAPLMLYLVRFFSWRTLEITVHSKIINQLSTYTLPITSAEFRIHWSFYIVMVYGLGVFTMLIRILISYFNAKKLLADSVPAILQGQQVFSNKNIKSPLTFGLLNAKIYFPFNAEERWTPREIQISLAHEKIHLKQNDTLWKFFSLLVQALSFFVPWSYYLHHKFTLLLEISCDEKTCRETTASINEYGNLLLAMTCIKPQNLIFTNISDSTLKRRFLAMKTKTIKRPLLTSLSCAALFLAASTAVAVTSGIVEKKTRFDISSKIFVNGELISSPHVRTRAHQKATILIGDTLANDGKQIIVSGHSLKLELIARNVTVPGNKDAIGLITTFNIKMERIKCILIHK